MENVKNQHCQTSSKVSKNKRTQMKLAAKIEQHETTKSLERKVVLEQIRNESKGASKRNEEAVIKEGQKKIEEALISGAIALIDAEWLVDYAYASIPENQGGTSTKPTVTPLPCRQDLPPEAFLTLEQIKPYQNLVNVTVLSYMWLHPSHPDPFGVTLQLVANACIQRHFSSNQGKVAPKAIFWDYLSLHQHPDPLRGSFRTSHHEQLFQQGLGALAALYSHPSTTCWKVTQFPLGYPEGYNLFHHFQNDEEGGGANVAPYYDRGWPYVESLLTSMTKDSNQTVDLCLDHQGEVMVGMSTFTKQRSAPVLPPQAWERLEQVTFSNAKADRPVVMQLYRTEFIRWFGCVTNLNYKRMEWGTPEVTQLARVIASGHVPNLERLDLSSNPGVDVIGWKALNDSLLKARNERNDKKHDDKNDEDTKAVDRPDESDDTNVGQPVLKQLTLRFDANQTKMAIRDEGIQALAPAILQTTVVDLFFAGIGVAGCASLAAAAASIASSSQQLGTSPHYQQKQQQPQIPLFHLQDLYLHCNPKIGDEGVRTLLAGSGGSTLFLGELKALSLDGCDVGEQGCQFLADAVEKIARPLVLEKLFLSRNRRMTDKCLSSLQRIVKGLPNLKEFVLDGRLSNLEEAILAENKKLKITWMGGKGSQAKSWSGLY